MKIKVITVGKLKEKYLKAGINEYLKRLQAYTKVELIEVPDERIPERASLAEEEKVLDKEGAKVLSRIKDKEYVILLDVQRKQMDSVSLASFIESKMVGGYSTITFVIGGSLGHGKEVYKRADYRLSFSELTFPHQLMRLILMEQIYRCFKIINHEVYHK